MRSLAGPAHHQDFWRLTEDALAWTAARHGIADPAVLADVLMAYRRLDAYPEAPDVLRRDSRGRGCARRSCRTANPGMLADATRSAGLDQLLDHILSIEAVGVFQAGSRASIAWQRTPGSAGGRHGVCVLECLGRVRRACSFGFRVFWINRSGAPAEYGLRERRDRTA